MTGRRGGEMTLRTMIVVMLTLTMAGCSNFHWRKPGADNDAFLRDSDECQQQAPAGQWKSCMTSKGWLEDTRL